MKMKILLLVLLSLASLTLAQHHGGGGGHHGGGHDESSSSSSHRGNVASGDVLPGIKWFYLLVCIVAVYSSWWKMPFPSVPYGVSQWGWRILWFLLKAGLVVGIFNYLYATATHHGVVSHDFNINHPAYIDWTWVLIIIHLVHVHANEVYASARFETAGYWVSTVLFVFTFIAGAAISALGFQQYVYGTGIGYAAYSLAQIIILIAFCVRYDRVSRNALRTIRNQARGLEYNPRDQSLQKQK